MGNSPGTRGPRRLRFCACRHSPYVDLDRGAWAKLGESAPLPLSAAELDGLRSLGDPVDLDEVREVYLPALPAADPARRGAPERLHEAYRTFLARATSRPRTPFVIGVAGCVAVGKSTIARLLQRLLARWPATPAGRAGHDRRLPLPQRRARAPRLMDRKGFPESYDRARAAAVRRR